MNRSYFRQWIQLSAIWVLIALVPIGRSLLNDQFSFQIGFNLTILFSGLALVPLLVWWFNYLHRKDVSWFRIIIIQLLLAVLLSLWFYFAVQEHPGIVKRRTSQVEVVQMGIIQKANFYLFSGNSYLIFTSLMMLSGFGLLVAYSEQGRLRKLRYEEFERNHLKENLQNETENPASDNDRSGQIRGKKIAVKTGKKYDFINPDEVISVAADGNYCDIKLSSGEHFLHRITLTELFSMLPKDKFMRIHQSYVISVDEVSQIKRLPFGELEVLMTDGQRLKVSRKHKRHVAELIKT